MGGNGRRARGFWRKLLNGIWLLGVVTAVAFTSEAGAREKWGPFRGRVVDLETGQPIAGAVILVVWWEAVFSPLGHPTEKFYDAREAVTDAEGRFEVPRLSVPFWELGIQAPQITIFAPGYVWQATLVTPPDGQEFVDPTVVEMRRLRTREERIHNLYRYPPSIPDYKMLRLLEAISKERVSLGLKP